MIRWLRDFVGIFLPFSRDARHTLLYLVIALCGPSLTIMGWWAMDEIRTFPDTTGEARLEAFAKLATMAMGGLLIIVIALSCFVSIRAIKIGLNGIEAQGSGGDQHAPTPTDKP